MIVDKINYYLTTNGQELHDELLKDVSASCVSIFERQFGLRDKGDGRLRLSSIGKCIRQNAYNILGTPPNGKEIDSRAKMVFFQGDMVELAIINLAKIAGCKIEDCGLSQKTVEIDGIQGHPDGVVEHEGEKYLLEVKSMSSYAFQKFESKKTNLEEDLVDGLGISYWYQFNAYMHALGLNKCIFVALNKDSGIMQERIYSIDQGIVKKIKNNIFILKGLQEYPEHELETIFPGRPYTPDKNNELPWMCLYCSHWKTCWPTAEKVLVGRAYKLKVK